MANPRDNLTGAPLNERREMYIHPETGRTHIRAPAGGTGGGITSYADVPASEEQHVAFLEAQAKVKAAEGENLTQQHKEARENLDKKRGEKKDGERMVDVNNPITDMTYGRPPQHAEGLDSQGGPRNPGDERDPPENQPMSAPVKEDDRRTPVKETT